MDDHEVEYLAREYTTRLGILMGMGKRGAQTGDYTELKEYLAVSSVAEVVLDALLSNAALVRIAPPENENAQSILRWQALTIRSAIGKIMGTDEATLDEVVRRIEMVTSNETRKNPQ